MLNIKSTAKMLAIIAAALALPVYADVGPGYDNANSMQTATPTTATTTTTTTVPSDGAITAKANALVNNLNGNNKIAAGSNLQISTSNSVITVTGTVAAAADVNTVKNALTGITGVKDVNMDGVTVSTP